MIADMLGVGPLTPGDPDVPLCVALWYVTAYDPQGKKRGTGIDTTLTRAAAAAWVLSHDEIADQFGYVPLSLRDFNCVPRHVPDGWTFKVENMPRDVSRLLRTEILTKLGGPPLQKMRGRRKIPSQKNLPVWPNKRRKV